MRWEDHAWAEKSVMITGRNVLLDRQLELSIYMLLDKNRREYRYGTTNTTNMTHRDQALRAQWNFSLSVAMQQSALALPSFSNLKRQQPFAFLTWPGPISLKLHWLMTCCYHGWTPENVTMMHRQKIHIGKQRCGKTQSTHDGGNGSWPVPESGSIPHFA